MLSFAPGALRGDHLVDGVVDGVVRPRLELGEHLLGGGIDRADHGRFCGDRAAQSWRITFSGAHAEDDALLAGVSVGIAAVAARERLDVAPWTRSGRRRGSTRPLNAAQRSPSSKQRLMRGSRRSHRSFGASDAWCS